MHDAIDARISHLAVTQQGLVTRQQLLDLGLTRRRIAGRLRRGQMRRIHRGVYLVGPLTGAWTAERAALLAVPRGALSHWTAVRVAGVPLPDGVGERVTMIAPAGVSGRPAGIIVHRMRTLHPVEVHRVHDMAVTTPARTLFDLATPLGRAGDARRLEQLAALMLDRRLASLAELHDVARRHAQQRGAGLLRLILESYGGPALTRSEAEERLLALLRAADLPLPHCNVRIGPREVDCAWERERLVVEVDGYEWHSSRNRFENDRTRDAALVAAGYTVLRFTWRQLDTEPQLVQSRIAFVLGRLTALFA